LNSLVVTVFLKKKNQRIRFSQPAILDLHFLGIPHRAKAVMQGHTLREERNQQRAAAEMSGLCLHKSMILQFF